MKKRILSIALAVVMVVVMLPVAMISASAAYHIANDTAIDTYYGDVDITIDGERDDIYLKSEKTTNLYTTGYSGFEGYFVATDDGLYFFAEIVDKTIGYEYMQYNPKRGAVNDVSNQDKIQVYYTFANTWGYVEFDYFYNNADATFLPGDLAEATPLHHARFKHAAKGLDTNDVESYFTAATTVDLEAGKWTAEFFLPWDVAGYVDGSAAPYATAVGIQVNNDRWEMGKTDPTRDGLSYNAITGTGWWQGLNASDFVALKFLGVDVASTANGQYTAKVTSNPVTVDGKLDDVYLEGDVIKNGEYIYKDKSLEEIPAYTGFTAYTAATLDGFYVYLDVNDETMNNIAASDTNALDGGDRVQFYIDMTPAGYRHDDGLFVYMSGDSRDYERTNAFDGGWIGVDYNGNLGGISYGKNLADLKGSIDFEIVKRENPDWNGTDPQTQYVGYIVEMFIPWTPWMANAIGRQDVTHFGFGIEVQDDCTYDDSTNRGVIIGNDGFLSYYYSASILPDIVFDYGTTPNFLNSHYGAIVDAATVDGVNTDGEYDGAQVIHVNMDGAGTADDGDIYRIITDGKSIYVLCEMVDTTPSDHAKQLGDYMDYCDIFFSFGPRLATYASFYRDYFSKSETGEFDPVTYQPIIKYTYANVRGGYNGGSIQFHPDLGNFAVVDNREAGWSFEIKIDLTAEEQAQLAAGTFEFGMAAQYLDGIEGGRNFKYDMAGAGSFWSLGSYINKFHPVRFVDSDLMDVEAGFTAAQVALGESIAVNFFANLSLYETDAKLKVTYNGAEYILGAQKTDVADEYKFVFEGIAPQCMGDTIDAELIVDGVVVDTIIDYSVRQNCLNLIAKGVDAKTQQLIADLAAYGAAAQIAANYKTDDLVNAGFEDYATDITEIENSDKTVTGEATEELAFTAAGVYFDFANKVYVKFIASEGALDCDGFSITIDGVEAKFVATGVENEYIVYTDYVSVTDFDKVFEFVLTDGITTQTVTYSVNAYCAAKINTATYGTTKTLVAATYAYGLSAAAYLA